MSIADGVDDVIRRKQVGAMTNQQDNVRLEAEHPTALQNQEIGNRTVLRDRKIQRLPALRTRDRFLSIEACLHERLEGVAVRYAIAHHIGRPENGDAMRARSRFLRIILVPHPPGIGPERMATEHDSEERM